MTRIGLCLAVGVALATPALSADLKTVAKGPPAPEPSPWDFAFGGGLTSDYIFRGVTQSNHKPSVTAYFEPRYILTKDLQLYVGISGESISFPNRAAAEIDIYGGVRPTFGPVAFDFGGWYYWYPGGRCFNGSVAPVFGADCLANGFLPINNNVDKKDLSFFEAYAKAAVTLNDQFSWGGSVWYSPSALNSGAHGTYASLNAKVTAPSTALPTGWGLYASSEVGYWWFGTTDKFYCTLVAVPGGMGCGGAFPNGIPYKGYATWNVGVGVTKSVFTLDFRYYQTNLNKGDCNAFTSDHTAQFTASFTAINPGGFGSNWCGASFVVAGKFDLTAMANLK